MNKFVSDLLQVNGFVLVIRFLSPINSITMIKNKAIM